MACFHPYNYRLPHPPLRDDLPNLPEDIHRIYNVGGERVFFNLITQLQCSKNTYPPNSSGFRNLIKGLQSRAVFTQYSVLPLR
jgi:hypothetical protein